MTTWLHRQRLDAVRTTVLACGARTIVDLGCGDGDLLIQLVREPQIERVLGIDASQPALDRLAARLEEQPSDGRAAVQLVTGSLLDRMKLDASFDCAVLVETIEHLEPGSLSMLERSVFSEMAPRSVVITTPNADYNVLLGVPAHRFRHPDHRFEWSRNRFQIWANGVGFRNGYAVRHSDIGGNHPQLGGASQMALFQRADDTIS